MFPDRTNLNSVAECRAGIMQFLAHDGDVGKSIEWYGESRQHEVDFLLGLLPPDATVIEVDAGIGAQTLALVQALNDGGDYLVYEARPIHQEILRQNLSANAIRSVTVMKRRLGAIAEADGASTAATTCLQPDSFSDGWETLDDLHLERLDWVKFGDPGSVAGVLEGGTDTIWRLRPKLFSVASGEVDAEAIASMVKRLSYRCWTMRSPLFNANNFNRRTNDIFDGANALAVVALPEELEVDVALPHCVEIV